MPHYETVLILRQDLSSSQAENIALRTQQDLKKAEASIERAESWGLRTLAYPIRKNRKGHYFIINHSNEPQTTQEMQRILSLSEDLLRILTVKTPQPRTQPTPIAKSLAQREPETTPSRTTRDTTPSRTTPTTRDTTPSRTTPTTRDTENDTKTDDARQENTQENTPDDTQENTPDDTQENTQENTPDDTEKTP